MFMIIPLSIFALLQPAMFTTASLSNTTSSHGLTRQLPADLADDMSSPTSMITARQIHNADYSSSSGPSGDPQPQPQPQPQSQPSNAHPSSAPSQAAHRLKRSHTSNFDRTINEDGQHKRQISSTLTHVTDASNSENKRANPSHISDPSIPQTSNARRDGSTQANNPGDLRHMVEDHTNNIQVNAANGPDIPL